jgi:hypothetical protein
MNIIKLFAITLLIGVNSSGETFNPLIESVILLNVTDVKRDSTPRISNRRSFQKLEDNNFEVNQNAFALDPTFSKLPPTNTMPFESSKDDSIPTSNSLNSSLQSIFKSSVNIEDDFADAVTYLCKNKVELGLSDDILISAIKSVYSSAVASQSDQISEAETTSEKSKFISFAPNSLLSNVMPYVEGWDSSGPAWVKYLARITTESLMEQGSANEDINLNANNFAEAVVEFVTTKQTYDVPGIHNEFEPVEPNRKTPNDVMQFGGLSGFDPENFAAFQQLAVGISQGYLNSKIAFSENDYSQGKDSQIAPLSLQDLRSFSNQEESILKSTTDGILSAMLKINENYPQISLNESSLYAYDSLKSLANGFVLTSTVYATSEPDYLANGLYIDAAELVSRSIAQTAVSHEIAKSEGISVGRIAESVSHGSAMGAQLATVLPKSMEYVKNWEIFSQSRRDVAQAVSRGSSYGAVDAGSIHFSNSPNLVEDISRGASLGSMIGTTGLAIYYPTDQLVPIINFTAQGSAYGSVNSKNLKNLKQDEFATEQINSSVARQSAVGSSMGAIFEPTVLLGLSPDTKSDDKQTIDNLSAATFGATFGAIQGAQDQDISDNEKGNSSNYNKNPVELVEITQSVKQGSIEGALAGAKLALGIESSSDENLNSKGTILKAINSSNNKAATDASSTASNSNSISNGSQLVANPLKTSSKDMLLLMRKFGINPRYTNAATMFKRPVVRPIDEAPEDLVSDSEPSSDGNQTYSENISNASPI